MKALFKKKIEFIKNHPRVDIAFLLIGLTAFAIITLVNITKTSIWFDEAFSFYITQFSFLEIAQFTAVDVHPPLYYWLLKIWEMLFGTSEAAIRSLSVLLGAVTVAISYLLSRRLFGRLAAGVTLLFLIVSPMLIRYSDEGRMYTLAAALVMGATYLLVKAMESNRRRTWVFYGILVSLGMWTHYFTALIWITHWIWRAVVLKRGTAKPKAFLKKFFTKNWIIAHVVAVGIFLPWLPFMFKQLTGLQGSGFWIAGVSIDSFTNYLSNLFYYLDHGEVLAWAAFLLFVVIVGLAVLAVRAYRSFNRADKNKYLLITMLAIAPVLILFIASLPPLRSSFVERYLLPAVVGFAVFAAVTIVVGTRKWHIAARIAAIVLPLGMMIYGVSNVYFQGNYNKNSDTHIMTRELVADIVANAEPGEPIIANSPWIFYEAVYYETKDHPVYFIDEKTPYIYGSVEMLRQSDMHKIKDLDAFLKEHPKVWYIGVSDSELLAPEGETNWTKLDAIYTTSPVNGRMQYHATQFQIN